MKFPLWSNKAFVLGLVFLGSVPVYLICVVAFATMPGTVSVGYAPEQPVPFSHRLHAGDLGLDCRYCHNTVEDSAHAAVPPTHTCMNCHTNIRNDSALLAPIRESYETGKPVEWNRVHDLPDYAYFNHSAHVTRGIGCASCHGRIDTMEVVTQQEPLSMGWCLDCHREPEQHLRPLDRITDMEWAPENQLEIGRRLREEYNINPSTSCSTCHR